MSRIHPASNMPFVILAEIGFTPEAIAQAKADSPYEELAMHNTSREHIEYAIIGVKYNNGASTFEDYGFSADACAEMRRTIQYTPGRSMRDAVYSAVIDRLYSGQRRIK